MPEAIVGVQFVDIPGFSGYRVGDDGTVWSIWGRGSDMKYPRKEWRKLRCWPDEDGYVRLVLYKESGKRSVRHVHKLVLLGFSGERPKGMVARHLNGIRTDNRLENLVWGTPKENSQDMIQHGHSQRGRLCIHGKLTEQDVRRIRELLNSGQTGVSVAKLFQVSPAQISAIRRRIAWAWLT